MVIERYAETPATYYAVPTGFTFTLVTTLREAKSLARQNPDGSQWFEKLTGKRDRKTGKCPRSKSRYTFNGRKWHHR